MLEDRREKLSVLSVSKDARIVGSRVKEKAVRYYLVAGRQIVFQFGEVTATFSTP